MQSCSWFTGVKPYTKQYGYVTDTNGVAIANVKFTVLESDDWRTWKETEHVFYSDETGYYEVQFNHDSNKDYKLKPTHNEYVYSLKIPNGYPNFGKGGEEELNIEMVKIGKVKINGDAICRDNNPVWLEGVKISLLKRLLESSDYPNLTDISTFTNGNGEFYIEYEGDENYEYFLKPEKEGYYYSGGSVIDSLGTAVNTDPGYIVKRSFSMEK